MTANKELDPQVLASEKADEWAKKEALKHAQALRELNKQDMVLKKAAQMQ